MTTDRIQIRTQNDIIMARKFVKDLTIKLGFGMTDQTKIVTAASELARNTLEYGLGGELVTEIIENDSGRKGIRLSFTDEGPGIADLNLALTDRYTSGSGMGLGLSGSRRLMSEFTIDSVVGKGTRVIVIKWK